MTEQPGPGERPETPQPPGGFPSVSPIPPVAPMPPAAPMPGADGATPEASPSPERVPDSDPAPPEHAGPHAPAPQRPAEGPSFVKPDVPEGSAPPQGVAYPPPVAAPPPAAAPPPGTHSPYGPPERYVLAVPQVPQPRTGLGVGGLASGIGSCVLALLGCCWWPLAVLPLVMGMAAAVLGFLGMQQVARSGGELTGRGISIAAIATGGSGALLSVLAMLGWLVANVGG